MLKITIAQLDSIINGFDQNIIKIKEFYQRACQNQARLLLTPELSLCAYLPQDAIRRPEFFEKSKQALEELKKISQGQNCALLVGYVLESPSGQARPQNVVSVIEKGEIVFTQAKTLLPYYDIFDEPRFFQPAEEIRLWNCDGYSLAFAICEDLWANIPLKGGDQQTIHSKNPVQEYQRLRPDLICTLSASPYEWGKQVRRYDIHQRIAKELKTPLIYVNRVGAMDGALFDGASFVVDANGVLLEELSCFAEQEAEVVFEKDEKASKISVKTPALPVRKDEGEMEKLTQGLLLGIRDYFKLSGFKKAIIGLSGGIDSALVVALAAKALGPKNVLGVAMPSQYSSPDSLEDAEKLAKNLDIIFYVKPIKFLFSMALREMQPVHTELLPIAQENLQSRLRGLILMTLSNQLSALVLGTGNKSEFAMGYATLYGDIIGALCPIGDLYKTRVYELARYLNQHYGNPIPERSIIRKPSAELKANQTDQDTLPPYDLLDQILEEYLEKLTPLEKIRERFEKQLKATPMSLDQIVRQIHNSEYKRKQAPLILKTSPQAFGPGRRMVMGSELL